jgi:protein gp37
MTFNSWWGCWKIADECKNCYADATAARYAPGHWGRTEPRRFFGDAHWNEPLKWNRKAKRDGVRRRVFVGSMMDWAEIHPVPEINAQMDAARDRLFDLIRECTALDWLLLTKRPENAPRILPWCRDGLHIAWPNVWLMGTAGTVKSLRRVVPLIRSIPAAVRGISCEPLLENIPGDEWRDALAPTKDEGPIHWLIVGNESGHKRRPAEMEWVRTARDAAARHGVAFHFKQWVEPNGKKIHLPMLDDVQHAAFPEVSRG